MNKLIEYGRIPGFQRVRRHSSFQRMSTKSSCNHAHPAQQRPDTHAKLPAGHLSGGHGTLQLLHGVLFNLPDTFRRYLVLACQVVER